MHGSFEKLRQLLNTAKTVEDILASKGIPGKLFNHDFVCGGAITSVFSPIMAHGTRLDFRVVAHITDVSGTMENARLVVMIEGTGSDGLHVGFYADASENAWKVGRNALSAGYDSRLSRLADRLGIIGIRDRESQTVTESTALELIAAFADYVAPYINE